jgi:hypothetical protein
MIKIHNKSSFSLLNYSRKVIKGTKIFIHQKEKEKIESTKVEIKFELKK